MTESQARSSLSWRDRDLIVEWLFGTLALAAVARGVWRFWQVGSFPHPWQSNSAEALMDLYNPAYWANHPGAYDVWHTVYLPLSFVFLRMITTPGCYVGGPYAARACDPAAAGIILAFFVLNLGLVFLSFRRLQPRSALPRTLGLCGGASMLYGLELANLIIPCFTAFILAEGPLLRQGWARQLFRAVAINFKPYLLLLALPQLARRQWRWLLGLGVIGLAIYAGTGALQGGGWPWEIIGNFYLYTLTLPDKYGANNHLAEIAQHTGGAWKLIFAIPLRLAEVAILGLLALSARWPEAIRSRRSTAMVLSVLCSEAAQHTQGYSADYTMIFLLFLIFMEPWPGVWRMVILSCAYGLCLAADLTLAPVVSVATQGYFAARPVMAHFDVTLGQFLRPAMLLIIQVGMIILAGQSVARAIRDKPARDEGVGPNWTD